MKFGSNFDNNAMLVQFVNERKFIRLIAGQRLYFTFFGDLFDVGFTFFLGESHENSHLSIILSFKLNKLNDLTI